MVSLLATPFGLLQEIGVVIGASALLLTVFVLIVCLVSPQCWCHENCPFAPRYPGEERRRLISKSQKRARLPFNSPPGYVKQVHDKDYEILSTIDETSYEREDVPTTESNLGTQPHYDSAGASPAPQEHFPPRPSRSIKSLDVFFRWFNREQILAVTLKKVSLPRSKRRKGVIVKAEVSTGRSSLLPWTSSAGGGGKGAIPPGDKIVGFTSEVREMCPDVVFEETFNVDWPLCRDRGRIKFEVQETDGANILDSLGVGELPLGDLDPTKPCLVRMILSPPKQHFKGEAEISLCYLPTAEKLSVILSECRHLRTNIPEGEQMDIYLRMSIIYKNRALRKKRSSIRTMKGPLLENVSLNVTHSFDIPRDKVNEVYLMLTFKRSPLHDPGLPKTDSDEHSSEIFSDEDFDSLPKRDVTIGTIVIGEDVTPTSAQAQWKEMIACPRVPIIYWQTIQ